MQNEEGTPRCRSSLSLSFPPLTFSTHSEEEEDDLVRRSWQLEGSIPLPPKSNKMFSRSLSNQLTRTLVTRNGGNRFRSCHAMIYDSSNNRGTIARKMLHSMSVLCGRTYNTMHSEAVVSRLYRDPNIIVVFCTQEYRRARALFFRKIPSQLVVPSCYFRPLQCLRMRNQSRSRVCLEFPNRTSIRPQSG